MRALCLGACLLGLFFAWPPPDLAPTPSGGFEWPLGSGTDAYPLAQTYGQVQGGESESGDSAGLDLHLGLDIFPKNECVENVYAIEDGVVKHVACTDPDRSGLVVESSTQPGVGFLYLHLDRYSIQLGYNATVTKGMLLGQVAHVSSNIKVGSHLHLARLSGYSGEAINVLPYWKSSADPLKLIDAQWYADQHPPTIHEIFVRKNDAGLEETLADFPLDEVEGTVDILAHITDVDDAGDSTLAPSLVRVEIEDEDGVVVHEATICFEDTLPSVESIYNVSAPHKSCGFKWCTTPLYYVVTTNGSKDCATSPNVSGSWSSVAGQYQVTVTAQDAAGNETKKSQPIKVP